MIHKFYEIDSQYLSMRILIRAKQTIKKAYGMSRAHFEG